MTMTMITGENNIKRYRLFVLKSALAFEIKTGFQLARGQSAYARIKNEFRLKGNKQKVLDQFVEINNLI